MFNANPGESCTATAAPSCSLWKTWRKNLLLFCSASVYIEFCLHLCVYRSLDRYAVYLLLFGLLGGVLLALLVRAFFVLVLNTPMPGIPAAVLLGVIGSVAGQVGDLTASLLKRHSGIKDYGKLFPGHGGVMDRFDSVIFALIVMYCYTLVLHG